MGYRGVGKQWGLLSDWLFDCFCYISLDFWEVERGKQAKVWGRVTDTKRFISVAFFVLGGYIGHYS